MTVMKKGSKKGGKEVTAWGKVDYREATAHKIEKRSLNKKNGLNTGF
jgi:hypothetical protein